MKLWNETQERHFLVFWTGFWKYVWLDIIKTFKHKHSIVAFKSQHYLTFNILQQLHSSHSTVPLLLWSFLVTEAEFSLRSPVSFDSVHIYIYIEIVRVPKSCWCSCRARIWPRGPSSFSLSIPFFCPCCVLTLSELEHPTVEPDQRELQTPDTNHRPSSQICSL